MAKPMQPQVTKVRPGCWQVRYDEYETIVDEQGRPTLQRRFRTRRFPTKGEADARAEAVRLAHAQGRIFVEEQFVPTCTLALVAKAYVAAALDAGAPITTQRFRSSMMGAFEAWVGDTRPVGDLSLTLLGEYAASLPGDGRKQTTRHRKLLEVERMWAWAYDRPERFPGVPLPRKITGTDADRIRPPPPVVAIAVPTWEDVDAMIACLKQRAWHRRAAIVQRYTGLRTAQIINLAWRDLDLDRGLLWIRAGVRGAKAGRTRVVPLHPDLIREMQAWDRYHPFVFAGPDKKWENNGGVPRESALLEPFRLAWTLAKVHRDKWDTPDPEDARPGDRAHGRPTHAIRAAFKSGLLVAGVAESAADYLVGHASNATDAAYVPQDPSHPESSPRWKMLVEAIAKVPPITNPTGSRAPA